MIRTERFFYLVIVFALAVSLEGLFAGSASGQVQTGTPPFGSFGGGPDTINLGNLNAHLTIPVLHKPGRGTNFTYGLSFDSSVWYPVTSGTTTTWQPVLNWGWTGSTLTTTGYAVYTTGTGSCRFFQETRWITEYSTRYTFKGYVDPFGTFHPMAGEVIIPAPDCGPQGPTTGTATAYDGSGYIMAIDNTPSATLHTSFGAVSPLPLNAPAAGKTFTDRNGNIISTDGSGHFYDTLSSTTAVLTLTGSGTALSPIKLTYTTSSGSSVYYQINYTNYTVATNFGLSGINETKSSAAVPLVTSVVLPDGSQYTFTYEATPSTPSSGACTPYAGTTCVTARIASIKMPTGGSITYAYSGGNNGILSDGSTATLTRTTPDGTWIYARTFVSGTQWQTIVTDPSTAANQTSIQFQSIYETQRKIYQGSTGGTLFQTINTCYNAATSPCMTTAITLPITQRTTLTTVPGSGNLIAQHTGKFDSFGNSTESDDYDLATAAPFPLLRQTLITYAGLGGYLNAFRQTVKVLNGSGTIQSRQDTNYDQYSGFTGANCITTAPNHDNTGHGCSFTARGNSTSVTNYTDPVTPGGAIIKNFTYDSLGNLRTAQLNCCQLKTWSYSTTTDYAYPDSVISGTSSPQLTTSFTYDLHMGLPLTSTDPNNVQSTFTYDSLGRPLTVKAGTNPATNYTYADYNNSTSFTPWTVQVCSPVQSTNTTCQKTILDNQGRTVTTQLLDVSAHLYAASDTQYDVFGRAFKASNPYTSAPSNWTQVGFDVLGRQTTTTLPDNSVNATTYSDNTATTTDPAGKQRKFVGDGLGRLTSVYEPDPSNSNSLTLQTSYTHNVFGLLTQVSQTPQTRNYVYDALGRLSSTTTPEAGTVCFGTYSGSTCQANGYDSFNNLLYRTDARGVVTNYLYDTLNRLVGVSYPTVPSGVAAMPNICKVNGSSTNNANSCLAYGTSAASFNNGSATSMTDPSGSESYSYDQYGNVTQLIKIIGPTTYTTSYTYNLANELTQITYPSGRVVQQSVDGIGRLCEIAPSTTGCGTASSPFATGFGFNSANQVTGFKYGNGIFASFGFSSDLLQLNCLDYSTTNRAGTCTHDSTTKFGLSYSYGASGSNNGQLGGTTDYVDSGRNATYTYDSLYRLTNASTPGSANYPAWGLSETYDRYGNRTDQNQTAGSPPMNHVLITAATNHISGSPYTYDLSGNMTNDGQNTLIYDGESHAVSATVTGSSSGNYTYDGKGIRVKVVSVISGTTTTTVYVFSGSKVIAEYVNGTSPSAPTREYIYAGAALLAKIDSTGTKYYHQDHLSNRLVTDSSGNTSAQMGHFPFGESWYNSTNDKLLFTSYERDSESGNDYAKARYYVNRLGRFSSPDPLSGSTGNPQSLNRYSYALNAPTSLLDPTGMSYCENIDDAKALKKRTRLIATKFGPYSLDESENVEQDPGGVPSDCTIESGGDGADGLLSVLSDDELLNLLDSADPGAYLDYLFGLVPLIQVDSLPGGQSDPETTIGPANTDAASNGSGDGDCILPTTFQKIGIAAQRVVAKASNKTIGVGLGGTAGVGNIIGVTISFSRQLVVSPNGQAAFETTVTAPVGLPFNSLVSAGAGGYGGFQFSFSNATTPQDLKATFISGGAGGGGGWGGGGDVALGSGTKGQFVYQATATVGGGAGGYGHGVSFTYTVLTPICND
jgi:RHS repeat-associated protein